MEESGDTAAAARKDHIITPFEIFQLDCHVSPGFQSLLAVSLEVCLIDNEILRKYSQRMNERIFSRRDDEGTLFY